ncbi:MAG: HEAT repeat domain-containing protein [Cyclobacteriaceae bacterium]|nr:HEAT repeat domain-containing protein [Cyclobacteriaceae bacterium]
MEREKLESQLIDYIDGKLSESERIALEHQLSRDPEVLRLYEQLREVMRAMDRSVSLEPSAGMRTRFERMLAEEMKQRPTGRQVFFRPSFYRIAAAVALVAAGLAGGYWISVQQRQNEELLALRKEMESTKQLMQAMLQNQSSASQRLQGVSVAMQMNSADDDVVNALVRTMNEDPNSNVRLAALDALANFSQEPDVRKALVSSLSTQTDPIVQIALIQLLVRMKEKSVLKDLERMVEDETNLKAVKDEAYNGILKLS